MRSWRRASKWLDCGGPEPRCRIESGAPYQHLELALGIIKYRCVEHAFDPVNQAQIDAFDAQQAAGDARSADAAGRCFSFCSQGPTRARAGAALGAAPAASQSEPPSAETPRV